MNPFYQRDGITIYHGDQSEILPQLVNVDTVITDPPYGIDHDTEYNFSGGSVLGNQYKRIKGDDKPFDPSHLLNYRKVILWGANCYSDKLPQGSWLVWNKRQPKGNKNVMSDAEVAWMNTGHGVYIFDHIWDGFIRQSEKGENYHPTQKPVALMRWCIQKAKPQGVIVDPYFGSGSLLVAARDLGFQAIGIEAEIEYCRVAVSRLAQQTLFTLPNNRLHMDAGDSPRLPSQSTLEGFTPAEQGTTPAPRQ